MDIRKRSLHYDIKGGGIMNEVIRLIDSRIDDIIRFGVVKSTSPLTVLYTGETANSSVKRVSGYSPTLDDYVMLVKHKNTYICIGKVV